MSKHRRPADRRRPGMALAVASVAALTLGASSPALAAKGGGGGSQPRDTTTMRLVPLDSTDGTVHRGQRVTFEVSTTATDRPFVGIRCWQGSAYVFDGYIGLFEGTTDDQWEIMNSTYWLDGLDASCTARLFWYDRRGNEKLLMTMQFPVLP